MKNILIFLIVVIGFAVSAHSQIINKNVKNAVTSKTTTATGLDVKSLASSVMSKLTPSLALTAVQKPQVLSAVTSFFQKKSSIMSLATTDKAQYSSKLSGLTSGLTTKLKGILTADQYAKLLGLKPAKASPTNALSQLFF
jgi:hypothetical protein